MRPGIDRVGAGAALASDAVALLIAARAVMGIGAALMMPATLSILVQVFSGAERTKAVAIWGATSGVGVALGPVLGGLLLEHFSWRSVFVVHVPLVMASLTLVRAYLPEFRAHAPRGLDPLGAVLSTVGLSALTYTLIEAPSLGLRNPSLMAAAGTALFALSALGFWQLRAPEPMLELSLFRNRQFSAASLGMTALFFGLFGAVFVFTQYMQLVLGYSPLAAGVRLLPLAATLMVFSPLGAVLAQRFGARAIVTTGLVVLAGGLLCARWADLESGYGPMALTIVLIAVGMGLSTAPATESIMHALPEHKAGIGSAVNDTVRELGGALGVAIVGSVFAGSYAARLDAAVWVCVVADKQKSGNSTGIALSQITFVRPIAPASAGSGRSTARAGHRVGGYFRRARRRRDGARAVAEQHVRVARRQVPAASRHAGARRGGGATSAVVVRMDARVTGGARRCLLSHQL